jgi:hypothetical protein
MCRLVSSVSAIIASQVPALNARISQFAAEPTGLRPQPRLDAAQTATGRRSAAAAGRDGS